MPIEIKELHIRVAVNVPQSGQSSGAQPVAVGGNASGGNESEKETMVAECVEQVLQILQGKAER